MKASDQMQHVVRGDRSTAVWGMIAVISLACVGVVRGEDVVYFKPGASGKAAQLRGEVVDYTGRELRLRNAAGSERAIPVAQIERVETNHSPEEVAGDRLYEQGDFRGAIGRYRAALEARNEPRDWVRRKILTQIIWCQRNLEEWDQAGEYFLILLGSDPATADFDCIPLVWTNDPPRPEIERKAQSWLNNAQPAAVLMGGSLLLTTPSRATALAKLRELLSSDDPRIAWLAYCQLWRAGAANATPDQQRSLAGRIEQNDERLRAGAYFVLGRSLAAEQPEEAAISLMKLPIVYDDEYQLSAAALVDAGDCLQRLNRVAQAVGLYREVGERFPHSAVAAKAEQKLARLASGATTGENEP